jgi:hypothetical protein
MRQPIVETTFDRIIKHFSAVGYPVGIISAFRPIYTFAENIKRTLELENKIKSLQWNYTRIVGAWKDQETGEQSFLIVGKGQCAEIKEQLQLPLFIKVHAHHQDNEKAKRFIDTEEDQTMLRFLQRQSRFYEQDGFIFKSSNGQTVILSPDLEVIAGPFLKITLKELEDGYSRLRGLVFAFDDAPIENWIGRMVRMLAGSRGLV